MRTRAIAILGLSVLIPLSACADADSAIDKRASPAGGIPSPSQRPEQSASARWEAWKTSHDFNHMFTATAYRFNTLPEMVATADVVAEVEVVSVAREDGAGGAEPPQHGSTVNRLSTVKTLHSFSGDAPATMVIAEYGWDENNRRLATDSWPGLEVGDRVICFLHESRTADGAEIYVSLKSTGLALVAAEDAPIFTGAPTDEVGEQIRLLTPPALRAAIVEAKQVVDATGMRPLKPGENMGVATTGDEPSLPPPDVDNPSGKKS